MTGGIRRDVDVLLQMWGDVYTTLVQRSGRLTCLGRPALSQTVCMWTAALTLPKGRNLMNAGWL